MFDSFKQKNFSSFNKDKSNIKRILNRSSKAVCGIQEREIVVPAAKVNSTISELKSKGFVIIGTSHGNTPSKKIWFIRAGGF